MKISFMTFACPDWSLPDVVAIAHRLGYQGVEFRTDAGHAHGVEVDASPEQRRAARQRLADAGVEPCCLATSLQFSKPQVIEEAPARIDLAADLGCPALRVFCGKPDGEALDRSALIDRAAQHLRQVAERAQAAGVELWIETHDEFSLAADATAAVRQADHPAVGLNYDNMHPYRNGESLEDTRRYIEGLVRHTHFHDAVNDPGKPIITAVGEGGMPCDDMFAMLKDQGFAGYLSGEWFGTQYGPDPESSLTRFRDDMRALAERHGVSLG